VQFAVYAVGFGVFGLVYGVLFDRRLRGVEDKAVEEWWIYRHFACVRWCCRQRASWTSRIKLPTSSAYLGSQQLSGMLTAAEIRWNAERRAHQLRLRIFVVAGFCIGLCWAALFLWVIHVGKLNAEQYFFYLWFAQELEVALSVALLVVLSAGALPCTGHILECVRCRCRCSRLSSRACPSRVSQTGVCDAQAKPRATRGRRRVAASWAS
jgi:hypothetical protein